MAKKKNEQEQQVAAPDLSKITEEVDKSIQGVDYDKVIQNDVQDLNAQLNSAVDTNRQQIEDSYDNAAFDIDKMISSARISRQEQKNAAKEEEKTARQTSRFGGLAEAAAALVNLIGTTKGAANQTWQSPLPGLQQRIDQIMREREAKLDKYNEQIQSIREKRSALDMARTEALNKYDQNKVSQQIALNKQQMDLNQAASKQYIDMQNLLMKQVGVQQKDQQAFANTMNKFYDSYRKNYGKEPSKEQVNEFMMEAFPHYYKQEGSASKASGMAGKIFG